ncbi:MAG: hypothetical protein ACTSR8_01785 [Promethearchaeota archaeon]
MIISEILGIPEEQRILSEQIIKESKDRAEQPLVLSSGSQRVNKALGGGFYFGNMYIIFGSFKTGKTQICHQLCVQAYISYLANSLKKSIHKQKYIYYFDTEASFRPERIREMVSFHTRGHDEILDKIIVSNILSNSALLLALNKLKKRLRNHPPLLIIIDTINNKFRSEQFESANHQKVRSEYLRILDLLSSLTKEQNILTIATAQVTPNFTENAYIKEIPASNQFLNHYFSEYVYLSHKEEKRSYIHLVNSIRNPERKILYKITAEGIQDYKI